MGHICHEIVTKDAINKARIKNKERKIKNKERKINNDMCMVWYGMVWYGMV
ncbi:MAG: hypothetical protein QXK74_08390 [Candidatus Nitrosocaldaceae archaeon]